MAIYEVPGILSLLQPVHPVMSGRATISTPWEPRVSLKHSGFIAVLLCILPAFTPWMAGIGLMPQLVILTIFVVIAGLPHGALDMTLLKGAGIGRAGLAAAFAGYLGLAGLVGAGFAYFPTTALLIFLGVAWLHFGLGDTEDLAGWHRGVECFARGGLAIAGPLTFHPVETLGLFTQLGGPASALHLAAIGDCFSFVAGPLWLGACLLVAGLRLRSALFMEASPGARLPHFLAAWEMVFLTLLFWLWPPLAAFGIYFCLVHSVRHLIHLAAARRPHDFPWAVRWLWRESWPIVGLTLVIGAILLWQWGGGISQDTLLLRLVFVGLAALTMPHMLLTYWWHRRGESAPGDFCANFHLRRRQFQIDLPKINHCQKTTGRGHDSQG